MKNRKSQNQFKQSMMECLIEIKKQLDVDPRVKTSLIVKSFDVYKSTFHHLKTIGVVSETSDGHFWIGNEPDWNMVSLIQKRESQYQMEYRKRKKSGSFEPMHRSSHKKGKHKPKPIQRNLVFDAAIGFDPESMENWYKKTEQSKTNSIKSDVPIRNVETKSNEKQPVEIFESEKRIKNLLELQSLNQKLLDETNKKLNQIKSSEQHDGKKSKTFEFRLFGFTFFSIKY